MQLWTSFYMTIIDEHMGDKPGRTKGKEYLVIGDDDKVNKFLFINDNGEFDLIEQHSCRFARFYNDIKAEDLSLEHNLEALNEELADFKEEYLMTKGLVNKLYDKFMNPIGTTIPEAKEPITKINNKGMRITENSK